MTIDNLKKSTWTISILAGLMIGITANATPIVATATLDRFQEVPASASTAFGAAVLSVEPTTGEFNFNLQITGISPGDLADLNLGAAISSIHLHSAPAGSNGPVVVDLGGGNTNVNVSPFGNGGLSVDVEGGFFGGIVGTDLASSNANLAELLLDNLYINVHTNDFLSGAIRGQLGVVQVPEPSGLAILSTFGLGFFGLRRRMA